MTNVVSYSLWGDNPKYTVGAVKNALGTAQWYHGWECRIYYSDVPSDIINQLKKFSNVNLINMGDGKGDWSGMFWRFLAADSDDVVISRDTDSRIGAREAGAVYKWLEEGDSFHIMRDHPYHGTPILGGMWGAQHGILKGITQDIEAFQKEERWQIDQDFLKTHVFPKVKNYACVHDPFYEHKEFPTRRKTGDFVGKAYNADGTECVPGLANMVGGSDR